MDRIAHIKESLKRFQTLTLVLVDEDVNYPKYLVEISDKNMPPVPILTIVDKIKEKRIGVSISLDACPFICSSILLSLKEKMNLDLLVPHYYSPLKNKTFYGIEAYNEKLKYEDQKNQYLQGLSDTMDLTVMKKETGTLH